MPFNNNAIDTTANNVATLTTLWIDTTSNVMALGLSKNGALIASVVEQSTSHRYHSAMLIPKVRDLLSEHALVPQDIQAIGVNVGPGSFTGIRTGLTVARIMAQFNAKTPLTMFAFNSFELIAAEASEKKINRHEPVTVALNALRDREYSATLVIDNGVPQYACEPVLQAIKEGVEPKFSELPENPVAVMHELVQHAAQSYQKPWQDVVPLYIQEPNITLKKTKAVTTAS